MILSFFSKNNQDNNHALLVDIGSASVGAAIVSLQAGGPPHVIASVREDISFQEALSSSHFLLAMNHALDKALESAKLAGKSVLPAHVFCTLSSPWFILKTRNLHVDRREEFEVTERTLAEFIDTDINLLKEELKETLPSEDMRIIEKKVLHIKLNGYEIRNPYGQKTNRMEVSTTVVVSSQRVIQSIERKIHNFFSVKAIDFGAFPVAAFSAVRDIFPSEKNFLFIDITGEATDVSLVENDLLVKNASFSRGKNFFIREISARLRTVHEEATTLFAMYLRGELDNARSAQIGGILAQAQEEWQARFKKAIVSIMESRSYPRKVFFTSDTDIAPLFASLIEKGKPDIFKEVASDVQYIDNLIVSKFVTFESGVVRDPFIVIEALLSKKIIEQHKKNE